MENGILLIVRKIVEPEVVIEGAGVKLRRSISPNVTNEFDPFLLLDHFSFNDPLEGPISGFPMHPHRGIETVTYMLQGSTHHRDSLGNAGLINPGDVQWMTSGRGIMHEEMPRRGPDGAVSGFQLWVNLPAAQKMTTPRYQEVTTDTIPELTRDGITVRIIAGEVWNTPGPVAEISAQPLYLDVSMSAGTTFTEAIPLGHTTFAYIFEGVGLFGSDNLRIEAVKLVAFSDGAELTVHSETGVRFLLVSGAPFGEPIVPYGPFVMNTVEEIQQAIAELRSGTFVKA